MTKQEVIKYLNENFNKPVAHVHFLRDEYIFKDDNGDLIDECGNVLDEKEFWEIRSGQYWEENWKVYRI